MSTSRFSSGLDVIDTVPLLVQSPASPKI